MHDSLTKHAAQLARLALADGLPDQPGVGIDDGLPWIHEPGSVGLSSGGLLSGTAQGDVYPGASLTAGEKTVS